jgi:hypothetical protein
VLNPSGQAPPVRQHPLALAVRRSCGCHSAHDGHRKSWRCTWPMHAHRPGERTANSKRG